MTLELMQTRERLHTLDIRADDLADNTVDSLRNFPTLAEFLSMANGRARKRLFDESDYDSFRFAASEAAIANGPVYVENNTGGVANNYGSTTTTARWGVWRMPSGRVEFIVDRPRISGRSVGCAYHGGERSYLKMYRTGIQS